MRGCPVDGSLNFTEGRLQDGSAAVKTYIHLEERLEHLLGKVASSADSLLHLVEGVLGGVEKGLIHGPRVVLGKLLDLLGADWLDVLIESV